MSEKSPKIKYSESDWLYATARVRALERRLPDAAAVERLLEAKDTAEICALCAENGLKLDPADYEAGLGEYLEHVFSEITAMAPDRSFTDIMRLPYDCHNIKSAVKCSVIGRSPAHLLYNTGTLPPDEIVRAVNERDFSQLPAHMAAAAPEALDAYAKTRDPQYIDTLLDAACALDKSELAQRGGQPFFTGWVSLCSDVTNILTCLRILRMTGEGADSDYLKRMLLPGGRLDEGFFLEAYYDGEAALWSKLSPTEYSSIAARIDTASDYSLTYVEKVCEDFRMEYLRGARKILAGAPALCAYLAAAEYYIKDIRIIIAGRQSGTDNETLRGRLRGTYV